jgi:hypothetical protein
VPLGFDDLGVRRSDGRRHHDDIGIADVLSGMSVVHSHTQRGQTVRDRCLLEIGSADAVSQIHEKLGYTAHATAAHTDQMNSPRSPEHG